MAQLSILEYPDERLRLPSEPVREFDATTRRLVEDLLDTLYGTTGIGLSAPQVGALQQVIAMDHSESRDAPEVVINPEILSRTAYGYVQERCLSVPGIVGNVIRATEIRVRYRDVEGLVVEREFSGMPAVCLLHEMDHLEGRLFIDRLSLLKRLRLRFSGALKQAG